MSGDPLKHVQSGDPLAIRAETFNCLIDAARDFKSRTRHLGRSSRSAPANPTVVSVRNDTGTDQPRFAVLGLDRPIVLPTDNLPEFASRATAVGVEPTTDHRGRWCLLAEPIPDGAIGKAYVAGISPVKLDVQQESDGYAEIEDGTTSQLVSGGGGSATILWKEDGTGPDKWAVVRFGDARPVVRKAEMIDTLRQGDASPASAWLMENVDDAWERTDQEIDVYGDKGFRGVAFGRTPEVDAGDQIDVHYAIEAGEWYAIVGAWYFHGDVVDDIAAGALGEVRLNVGAGGDTREITVPAYSPYTAVKQDDFVSANWNTFSLHWDIGKFQTVSPGCGLQEDDGVLKLKTSDVDGFGLRESDDTEDCELEVDPGDLAGCGLASDGAGQPLRVDRSALAGYALTDGAGTCDLDVDTPTLAGCGLATDGARNPLKIDRDALAGFGLVTGDGTCDLDVNVPALAGCGLTHDGAGTPLKVSPAALAGFGLVPGDGTCDLDVDTPALAGCGLLSDGAGQPLKLDALGVAGFGLVAVAPCVLAVDAAQLAGCGLIENPVTSQLDVFSAALAGPGLVPSGLCGLQVNVGCGLAIVADAVVFDAAAAAGDGLSAVGNCALKVDVGCGIKLELGAVAFDAPAVAGLGLVGAGCFLHVNVGDGLEIVADTIIVKAGCSIAVNAEDGSVEVDVATLAGDGLIASAGEVCDELAVQPGCGLEIAANKSVQIKRSHLLGDGLKAGDGSPCELAVDWEEFPGGCGLVLNGEFWDVDNTTLAGDGLVAGIGCSLAVNTGCGLTVNSGFVELDPDVIAGGGLVAGIGCTLAVETGCGLRIDGNAVAVDPADLASGDVGPTGAGCALETKGATCTVTVVENVTVDEYGDLVLTKRTLAFSNGLLKDCDV